LNHDPQCFIITGEASKYLDDNFKENYNYIPFEKLEEIENNLLYQYRDVNYNLIWKMVKEELPKLKLIIEKILKELEITYIRAPRNNIKTLIYSKNLKNK
jgi:uncharacterized protein with HEPN domain